MTQTLLLELFGSIKNEEVRKDDVELVDVVEAAFDQLGEFVDFGEIDRIYTGMSKDVTYTLIDHVNDNDLDIEIRSFYPNVADIADEDGISYGEAWKRGFTWRNNQLFRDTDDDQEVVDLAVRVGDAGSNGSHLLEQARRKGVPALDLNVDEVINRDLVYGEASESSTASA